MVNKCIFIGNLGANPAQKTTHGGTPISNFNIATARRWKDQDGQQQEETTWIRIVVFGPSADYCNQYLGRGSKVYVEGRLQTRGYEKDGQRHYVTEIIASTVQNLSPSNSGGGQHGGQAAGTGEDVPF